MNVNDYLLAHDGQPWHELLKEWAWLLPPTFTVWLVNRFGDLFLRLEDGAIHHLDVGSGTFRQVAATRDEFCTLCDDSKQAGFFLLAPLVDELVARGRTLGPNECYSFTHAPAFGGTFTPDNVVVRPIAEHYKIFGPLHYLTKDVPDGTHIKFSVVNRPPPTAHPI